MDLTIKHHVPIIFEVLMCDTYQKAEARIEKGAHAAEAAVRMVKFKQNDELLASASV
jgi:6,7-dimethyl-8-ribityllumazine synthase